MCPYSRGKSRFLGNFAKPKTKRPGKFPGDQNTASDPAATVAVATHLEKVAKGAACVDDVE